MVKLQQPSAFSPDILTISPCTTSIGLFWRRNRWHPAACAIFIDVFQTLLAADAGTTRLLFRSGTTRPGITYIFQRRSSQLVFVQGGAGWRYSARHYTCSKCQGRSSRHEPSDRSALFRHNAAVVRRRKGFYEEGPTYEYLALHEKLGSFCFGGRFIALREQRRRIGRADFT